MGFKLKSKKPGKKQDSIKNSPITQKSLSELDLKAIKELENKAKRQAETGIFASPSITVNKRYFVNLTASVERHNSKINKSSSDPKNK